MFDAHTPQKKPRIQKRKKIENLVLHTKISECHSYSLCDFSSIKSIQLVREKYVRFLKKIKLNFFSHFFFVHFETNIEK